MFENLKFELAHSIKKNVFMAFNFSQKNALHFLKKWQLFYFMETFCYYKNIYWNALVLSKKIVLVWFMFVVWYN